MPELPFFFSIPNLSVLYCVFETNSLVSVELTLITNSAYPVFLTTLVSTTLLSLYKSTRTVFNFSISILSTLDFQLANSVAPFKSAFVA